MSQRIDCILPHITYLDNDNGDPQMIMPRQPNIASLNIDSRLGRDAFASSSDILISSNISNPAYSPVELIKTARRGAIKHLELFFYLDNIIEGYNDNVIVAMQVDPPDPPSYTLINFTLPSGVYNVEEIGELIETGMNDWFAANWGSIPLPVATVTYNTPTPGVSGLLGSLEITVNYLTTQPLLALDPESPFIANSKSMIILSALNAFPNPTSPIARINFFSLTPYNYIDIVSDALTRNTKLLSSTNTLSNYRSMHRIYSPQYGMNVYDYTNPLRWFNLSKDDTLYNIDFKFVDNNGQLIRGALTRNFWFLLEILLEK